MSPRILPDAHQIAAADPRRSVFVTANAGSGKTSTLVDRVARLLLEEVQPGEILCVTYTRPRRPKCRRGCSTGSGNGPS